MKTTTQFLIPFLALTLLIGCSTDRSAKAPSVIQQAVKRYDSITPTMSREDVHRMLGEPKIVNADGTETWSVEHGGYVAMRTYKFSSSGRILEMTNPGLMMVGDR